MELHNSAGYSKIGLIKKTSIEISSSATMALRTKMSSFEPICCEFFWGKQAGSPGAAPPGEAPRRAAREATRES